MEPSIYKAPGPFVLETGHTLPELRIAYHTYGKPNAAYDNVVWVCHALTANSDVADWWPHTVEAGCFLDPARHFVVCANILGSHYGTTGPLHVNPETEAPITKISAVHDPRHRPCTPAVGRRTRHRPHRHARRQFGRGFQAIEWAVMEPERIGKLILIATAAKASPWTIAIDQTQRMAIEADTTFGEPRDDAGMAGLAAARALGLLTYRGSLGYNLTQQDREELPQYTAHRPTSNIRARNSAGATTPTRTMPYSTPSTRTTRGAGAAGWRQPSHASGPARRWSASRPTSSSPRPRCANCTA